MHGSHERPERVLVVGWFGFLHGEATAGDLLARTVAARWLLDAGISFDLASSPVLGDGVTPDTVDPRRYTHLLFLCGALVGWQVAELLDRFAHCRTVACGVSVVDKEIADRFDVVIARDAPGLARHADLAFAAPLERVPLVAVVHTPAPDEHLEGRHKDVHDAIEELFANRTLARVGVDTRIDPTTPDGRSPAQAATVLGRCDVVVTTRLHGLVLALRAGVPTLAVDPIAGGAKLSAQAQAIGWPAWLSAEDALEPERLDEALAWCLSPAAERLARRTSDRARREALALGTEALAALGIQPALG